MNNYIKLNNNNNHLSLGNLFNTIKNHSKNKSSAIQVEIFCILFNIDNISETTVNNYCTGYRAINNEYKQIYINYQKKYQKDKLILIQTINNLASIMDGYIYNYQKISEINNLESIKKLTISLHILAKNDIYVPNNLKKQILSYISKENYYLALCEMLFFIILEKKQPLYETDLVSETIEEILTNTNISVNDLKKFLRIQFKEGISFIPSLKKLAKENNPYAMYELGNLEYTGQITGKPRYDMAYIYYSQASTFEHPTAYWMLAHMIINQKLGPLSEENISLAWNYLKKAANLNSISALNSIGICYLKGYTENKKRNIDKAIKYFKKAANENYIYAYNNLGKIYEDKLDYENAFNYYLKAANEEESWACNKIAEFYRQGIYVDKDITKAYTYYFLGAQAPINNLCSWNNYNLAKYFYLSGNVNLGIKKDIDKAISLLETKDFEPNNELLLYAYYEKYLETNNQLYLDKINYYLNKINNSINIDISYKKEIENNIKNIYNINIQLLS